MTKTKVAGQISTRQAMVIMQVMIALVIVVVVSLWSFLNSKEQDNLEQHFLADITELKIKINERMIAYGQILKGGRGLFQVSDHVSRAEWHNYVSGLNLNAGYPGIQGVGYSALVEPDQRAAHENRIRAEGFSDYRIWPEGKRSLYSSIVYLEPFDWRNMRAFGYDMFSEPTRHEAMVRARDSGEPALSGKVLLVQETDEAPQAGTLLYIPMYRKGAEISTVQSRRDALIGWIYSPYRMDNLINGMLGTYGEDIHLHIYDGEKREENLLFSSGLSNGDSANENGGEILFEHTLNLEIGGRSWVLSFEAQPSYASSKTTAHIYTEMTGIMLISLLFIALAWNFLRTQHNAEKIAMELTAELRRNKERADTALTGTVLAISRMLEARDPYTSGHQRRVAELAKVIAEEMGLDAEAVEGIRIGALIHDIGKVELPAELLSRPSRLSDVEFELVKTHSRDGYDILKEIDFPWPVADIAHQHHEREDGSGYPQGLKGERICIGAKIVAVADVVEAMSSHRPYRPGLGIEAALEEIDRGRGTKYNEAVVAACLTIFKEGEFSFATESSPAPWA